MLSNVWPTVRTTHGAHQQLLHYRATTITNHDNCCWCCTNHYCAHWGSRALYLRWKNKGLCTLCDVNVWIVCQSGLEIKWCKGCKNFRPWAAFGDKGLATKCLRCRERQREKYALQKEEKEKARVPTSSTVAKQTEEKELGGTKPTAEWIEWTSTVKRSTLRNSGNDPFGSGIKSNRMKWNQIKSNELYQPCFPFHGVPGNGNTHNNSSSTVWAPEYVL